MHVKLGVWGVAMPEKNNFETKTNPEKTKKVYFCEELNGTFSEQEKIEIENYPLKLLGLSKNYEIIDGVVLDKRVEKLKERVKQSQGWQRIILYIKLKLRAFVSLA